MQLNNHPDDTDVELPMCSPRYTLLKETAAQEFTPTESEIRDYAEYIGLDPATDADLMHLALKGLTAQLPAEWQAYQNSLGEIFYCDKTTGVSSWDHPTDEYYRKLVREAKAEQKKPPMGDTDASQVEVDSTDDQGVLALRSTSTSTSFRTRFFNVVATPEAKVTVGSAVGGAVVLGGTGAVVGSTVGAVAGGAVGLVPAPFTFGLSIPVCAFIGGGMGLCAGTTTGASAGLLVGGAAGYSAYGRWSKAPAAVQVQEPMPCLGEESCGGQDKASLENPPIDFAVRGA